MSCNAAALAGFSDVLLTSPLARPALTCVLSIACSSLPMLSPRHPAATCKIVLTTSVCATALCFSQGSQCVLMSLMPSGAVRSLTLQLRGMICAANVKRRCMSCWGQRPQGIRSLCLQAQESGHLYRSVWQLIASICATTPVVQFCGLLLLQGFLYLVELMPAYGVPTYAEFCCEPCRAAASC